ALVALTWRDYPPASRRSLVGLAIVTSGLFLYFEFFMRLPSLYSWWKEPRYVLPLAVLLAAVSGIGLARWIAMVRGPARYAAYGYVAALLAFMSAFNIASVRADHEYWKQNRIDHVAQELAAVLKDRPEPTVFIWNDDLARYLAVHVGLNRTTFFERSRGEGYLQNRFAADGSSRVSPGSLVVTTPGQDHWSKPTAAADHWNLVWTDGHGTAVWAVPDPAPVVPMEMVNKSLSPPLSIKRAGLSRTAILPGQHLVVSLDITNAGSPQAIAAGVKCEGSTMELRKFEALSGTRTISMDLAMNVPPAAASRQCQLVAATDGQPWVEFGAIEVGSVTYLEPEADFSHDLDTERAKGNSWYRQDQSFYSGGGSVVAVAPFGPLTLGFPEVEGNVWVDLGVYNYGEAGSNVISVSVNGATGEIAWGPDSEVGVVHRVLALAEVRRGGEIVITVETVGQSAIVIDSVAISTIPPPLSTGSR
ncbi:MAG: hypothetical protein ABI782_06865, partial [Anaerolineaceae bacterium]